MIFSLPLITFIVLLALEKFLPTIKQNRNYDILDHLLNWTGLIIQGCVVPAMGYLISLIILPNVFPSGKGFLEIGWIGCFVLNLVVIDFLYYWQHRSFHYFQFLWDLHKCHHASKRVDIWATSRNSIIINFVFVYFLFNPFVAFFCDCPEAFYTGAMITASLDIFRHTQLDLNKLIPDRIMRVLSHILVMPCQHHHHHSLSKKSVNLAANFIIWDILFGTAQIDANYPHAYGVSEPRTRTI
jgi:sterol desaturase/sphingolipid hydroxylase (fatty acid hydroxylase superfamily)